MITTDNRRAIIGRPVSEESIGLGDDDDYGDENDDESD